jgi:mannose/fructose-specific phosphotransferase system component IIA
MLRYVIASHGTLSSGFLNALSLLAGDCKNVDIVKAFVDDQSLEDNVNDVISDYGSADTVVVFTDLYGGSVNQYFAKMLLDGRDIRLITGFNLILLIEIIIGMGDDFNEEFVMNAIERARGQMLYMNAALLMPADYSDCE